MSKYTTQLRYIVEQATSAVSSVVGIEERIAYFVTLDSFDNPFNGLAWRIPGENTQAINARKQELYNEFIHHYYFHEIGFETFGLWRDRLREEWVHTARKYYSLFAAEQDTVLKWYENYMRTRSRVLNSTAHTENQNSGTNSNQSSNNTLAWNLFNDTPQGGISWADVGANMYLTNAAKTDSSNTATASGTNSNTGESDGTSSENEIETVTGFDGEPYIKLLTYYKDNIFNVDNLFIDELQNLFMGVW